MSSVISLRVIGLRPQTTEEDLRASFAKHGFVQSVEFVEDELDGRVGVVKYVTRSALEAVGEARRDALRRRA